MVYACTNTLLEKLLKLRLEKRPFEITRIDLQIDFRVVCSKGTYIRSLAYDFGRTWILVRINCFRRTKIGDYNVIDATDVTLFEDQFSNQMYYRVSYFLLFLFNFQFGFQPK
jgi:tRNA U55 pseudouridine synthase TruB